MESPQALLEHATWLCRLAASLVRDHDDIVQDTWLAALRRPPQGAARPWLARVARNAVRLRWRGETNRAAREATVATLAETATPTSEALLARHQLQQLVARLVGELAEPFRTAILLRYAEGLEPAQIARQLAIPASTVRSRIKEGLERLRAGLDAAHGGDRKAWLAALAPIALWPGAARGAPAAGTAVPVLAIAATTLLGLLVVLATRAGGTSVVPTAHVTPAASVARAVAQIAAPSWFAQAGVPARQVAGRVVRDGQPVADALVRLVAGDTSVETRSDAQGRFDLGVQSPRVVTIAAGVSDALAAIRHVDLRDPAVGELELTLVACPARIAGHVRDASGNPIAHAQVLREGVIGTESDDHGAYELCALPTAALTPQLDIVVRAGGYGEIVAGVAPAGRMQRDFVLAPEATITGTAIAGAAIWLDADRDEVGRSTDRAARQVALADRDGRFRITGASGGRYRLGGAARGMLAVPALVRVAAGETVDVTVRMVPAATVHGRVVSHGAPVASVRVAARSDETSRAVARHDDPGQDRLPVGDAVSQPDGTFVLEGLPPGTTSFTATPMRVTSPPSTLAAGDNTVTIEVAPLGRIRGVVRRHGVPVPFARVDMGGTMYRGMTADGGGRYELDGLEPGQYGFYADDAQRGAFISTDKLTLADGETRDYDIELAWGAQISGDVVDASGAPVAGASVRFTAEREQGRCTTDARGAFACGSLRGGRSYTPTVSPADDGTQPFAFATPAAAIDLAPDAARAGVHLVIDTRMTSIAGSVVDDAGAPVADARLRVRGKDAATDSWVPPPTTVTDASGRFRFEHLAPGDYALEAESLDLSRAAQRIVTAGTSDVTLTLARTPCAATAAIEPSHRPTSPLVWDDRIELVGWELPATARAGEPLEIALVFRVRAPIAHQWAVFTHLAGTQHWHNADHAPLGERCPTTTWNPGDMLVDRVTTTVPLADRYTVRVGFFRGSDGDGAWQHLAGPGFPEGVELGTVIVEP